MHAPFGAVFPIGTTTAACTATDTSGNAAQGSFPVHVRGDEQLTRLLADAIAAGARPQITNRIPIVQGHLAAGRTTNGCRELDALISALAGGARQQARRGPRRRAHGGREADRGRVRLRA